MKTEDVFPSKWLGGDDLPHDVTVTIQRVALEPIRDPHTKKEQPKPVAYFVGKRKALILNVTNWRALVGLYGDESDGWAGKRVVIGPEVVDTPQGKMNAVRVRASKPGEAALETDTQEEDEEDETVQGSWDHAAILEAQRWLIENKIVPPETTLEATLGVMTLSPFKPGEYKNALGLTWFREWRGEVDKGLKSFEAAANANAAMKAEE